MNTAIKFTLLAIIVVFGAIYIGIGAASNQLATISVLAVALCFGVCLLMGRKIWLLVPLLGAVNFTLALPGGFSTQQMGEILFLAFTLLMIVTRKIEFKLKFTELEFWMLLLFLCVVQVYLRNPVGLNIFGSGSVGGRPYFLYVLAMATTIVMSGIRVPAKELKLGMRFLILGGLVNFCMGFVGWLIPSLGQFYGVGKVDSYDANSTAVDSSRASRVDFLTKIAPNLALWVSSFVSPLKACFSPKWMPLVLLSFAAAAVSGYRNVIVSVGLTYLVGLFYRGGMRSVGASILMGVLVLCALSAVNIITPLPANIQRTFSWLPGTWEEKYVDDAQASSDWRFEIWEEVLLTDNWIDNKLFGDGLGFTSQELAYQQELRSGGHATGISGFDAHRESILVNGDYHSGPVSAIRVIGYFGLAILFCCQLRLAVHAHRQIRRCQGTEWFPVALIFGIPLMWAPIFFVFVFGGFSQDVVTFLIGCAMIRLLENNLPLPAYQRGVSNAGQIHCETTSSYSLDKITSNRKS